MSCGYINIYPSHTSQIITVHSLRARFTLASHAPFEDRTEMVGWFTAHLLASFTAVASRHIQSLHALTLASQSHPSLPPLYRTVFLTVSYVVSVRSHSALFSIIQVCYLSILPPKLPSTGQCGCARARAGRSCPPPPPPPPPPTP